MLTPVDKSHRVFCPCSRRGYAAVAAASSWDFGWDWLTMTTLTAIQPHPMDATITHNNQIEQRREEEKGQVKVAAALAKRGGV